MNINIGDEIHYQGKECHLNHGKYFPKDTRAIDCIVVPQKTLKALNIIIKPKTLIEIPVCSECFDGLKDPDWFLYYCFGCGNSAWKSRQFSKHYGKILPKGDIAWCWECSTCSSDGRVRVACLDSLAGRSRIAFDALMHPEVVGQL